MNSDARFGNLALEISQRRAHGIEAMAGLSGAVSQLLDSSAHLAAGLTTLSGTANANTSEVTLHDLAQEVAVIQERLRAWNQQLAQDTHTREFQKIQFSLADLRKIVVKFHMIALQAQIQISAEQGTGADNFIQELRAVPVEISTCLGGLADSAQTVESDHHTAKVQCQNALQAILAIDQIFSAAIGAIDGQTDAAALAKAQISTLIDRLQSDTRKHSKSMISSFQFSDFFAQRMDHVAQLLSQSGALILPCAIIAGAQLGALVQDGRAIMGQLSQAVEDLSRMRANFLAAYGSIDTALHAVIQGQMGALQQTLSQRDQAIHAVDRAIAATENIHFGVGAAQTKFHELSRLSTLIDLAAINARLRAERMHAAQRPMAVLSAAVMQTAADSRMTMQECQTALAHVAQAQAGADTVELRRNLQHFNQTYAACELAVTSAQTRVAQLTGLREEVIVSLGQLDQCLAATKGVTGAISHFLNELEHLAQTCPQPPARMVWPDMDEIFEIYTMDVEREVHNRVTGRSSNPSLAFGAGAAAPKPLAAVDLDSVFF